MTRSECDAQHQPVNVSGWVWCKGAVVCVCTYACTCVCVPMPAFLCEAGMGGACVCLCSVGCWHGGDLLCSGLGQNSSHASLCYCS